VAYRVHITRRKRWSRSEGFDISRSDWRRYIEADPELVHDGKDSARWSGPTTVECALLTWRDGNIEAYEPDPALTAKMARVAAALDAHAQGDAGGCYDLVGNIVAVVPETPAGRVMLDLSGWLRTVRVPSDAVVKFLLVGGSVIALVVSLAITAVSVCSLR